MQTLGRTKCKDFFGEKKGNWNMDKAADIKELLLKFTKHN